MAKISTRNLLSLIQKRFLRTNPILCSTPKPPPSNSALSFTKCRKVPKSPAPIRPESVPIFNRRLKSYGFDDTHIAKLVKRRPDILHSRFNSSLKPKLEYLIEKGFNGKLLAELIVSYPLILFRSLDSQIKPNLEFLSQILKADELLVAIKRTSSWILTYSLRSIIRPNIDLLLSEGISASRIAKLLVLQPRVILQSHARMIYAVKKIKEIGLAPEQPRFIHALRVICSVSNSNWKKKVDTFMSLGWSKEEVFNTLRKDPLCLACSERKLRNLMDLYVNMMKLDARTIRSYPKLLLYSADKRIIARYKVLKVLESMKLLKEDKKIVWVITLSEKKFLEKYINKNEDKVPGLLDMYSQAVKQRKTSRKNNETIDPNSASLAL